MALLLALGLSQPAAADTLTPGLKLIKISVDVEDPNRTWGSKEDENKDILDAAICDKRVGCTITGQLIVQTTIQAAAIIAESSVSVNAPLTGDGLTDTPIGVDSSSVTLLGPSIGASEVDADIATQAELQAVADDVAASTNTLSTSTDTLETSKVNRAGDTMTGDLTINTVIRAAFGSAAAPSYLFSGDPDTGMYMSSADGNLRFAVGGADRIQVFSNLIQFSHPLATVSGAATAPTYSFSDDINTGMFRPSPLDNLAFATAGLERLRIDSAGKVGIGLTAPTEPLHVAGGGILVTGAGSPSTVASQSYFDFSGFGPRIVGQGIDATTRSGFSILLREGDGGNGKTPIEIQTDGDIILGKDGDRVAIGTDAPCSTCTRLHVTGGDVSFAGALQVDGGINGNLGIGTVSPEAPLHVVGNSTVTGTAFAGTMQVNDLVSCDTIDTDSSGVVSCGTDANTNADTICAGTDNYLDGEGNCDVLTAGTGDVVLAATQTFTGANTFVSSVTITHVAPSAPAANTIYADSIIKAWCNFDGTLTGPITCRDELNVVDVTDNGAGDYTVNWDTDFADGNYAAVCTGDVDIGVDIAGCDVQETTTLVGSIRLLMFGFNGAARDSSVVSVIAMGDQ